MKNENLIQDVCFQLKFLCDCINLGHIPTAVLLKREASCENLDNLIEQLKASLNE